ncbi:MAG: M23 family peptidase, partial [Burkholderiales bacterium]|nr:M23 family peptidase [Burkholderiales bacterium]
MPSRRWALAGALAVATWPALRPAWAAPANRTDGPLPRTLQVPGGVARLALGPAAARPRAFTAATDGASEVPLLVLGDPRGWTAVLGIALSASTGAAQIRVEDAGGSSRTIAYTIAPKQYREQRLTVAPRTVDLSPEDEARWECERA